MVHQNEMLCVPSIKWLGVYPTDIVSLNLPSITLTSLDQERLKSLLKRSYINSNHKLLQQVFLKLNVISCSHNGAYIIVNIVKTYWLLNSILFRFLVGKVIKFVQFS